MSKIYKQATGLTMLMLMAFSLSFAQDGNVVINGDIETMEPGFFTKMNGTTELIWADDTSAISTNARRSYKVVKDAVSSGEIGWKSVNNANLLWQNLDAGSFDLKFSAKTEGVNTSPTSDDDKIFVRYTFQDSDEVVIGEKLVYVDQTTANTSFTEYTDALLLTGVPEFYYAELVMGKDATGTVWFDNVGPSIFNGNAETPVGWTNWSADHGFANFVHMGDSAHSGEYGVLLKEEDDNDDEMVFNGFPVPAMENKWYRISFWVKTMDVNTDTTFMLSGVNTDRDNGRIGITFFYHKAPIETSWSLLGGDQFVYIDQRPAYSTSDWTEISFVSKAPAEAAGVSMRARFTSFPTGTVWYDDFSIEEISMDDNVVINGDIETMEPGFFTKMNGTTELIWADDTSAISTNARRSYKVVKDAVSSGEIGWKSVNNANLLWQNLDAGSFDLKFSAKTEGVNTSPTSDDDKIFVRYTFQDSDEVVIGEKLVYVDQTTANTSFTEYTDALLLTGVPEFYYAELVMGKDATGTVWFDNVGPSIFNGNAETPVGWTNWSTDHGFANFVHMGDSAHSGEYGVLLKEEDDNDDEMVFNGFPVPAEEGEYYMISYYTKGMGLSTKDFLMNSGPVTDRDNDRIGITFFYHKAPIETSWSLLGGDQFIYIDQRVGKENQDWTMHTAISKAPAETGGVSMRARFTSFPQGTVWYDDFSIQKVTLIVTSIEDFGPGGATVASDYRLGNNYPNPFNPLTHIEFYVPKTGKVDLAVYNALGQKIKTLSSGVLRAGNHYALWDGRNEAGNVVASGMYFYQLRGANSVMTKKMQFIK